MNGKPRREADGQIHHPPGSVEQQSEDSLPTSDPPSFMGGQIIGAPDERKSTANEHGAKRAPRAKGGAE
jgi:hypothetical protein